MDIVLEKCCRSCGVSKPIDQFTTDKRNRDGHGSYCIPCQRAKGIQSKKNANNPDRDRRDRKPRFTPEQLREHERTRKRRHLKKPSRVAHRHWREWRIRITGTITRQQWKNICDKFDNRCLRCGRQDVPLTVDHIFPLVAGGTHTEDNVQPLCRSCNSHKGARSIDFRRD